MKSEAEVTLQILECYLRYGPSLSVKDLCMKIKVSEKKVRYILSVLEKRGYLTKNEVTDGYILSKKIAMLV
ncbi:MAG: winged helix-turn-helix transcriptional regulator [Candidatus Omnitrophota bacterium]|nr:winged helix-turn-helix transcriptional regulator [Candidatus Omnitrophota bacterium]